MNIDKIPVGNNVPFDINVIIEIPAHSLPVKYEFDKESGAIFVDRFIATSMHYPANYGFIPHTLANDGDPLDCLVITKHPLIHGCVINVKPIGIIIMEDEKGLDEKVIAVPTSKLDKHYENINTIDDLPIHFVQEVIHFFERYKDLEKGKWVKIIDTKSSQAAMDIIKKYII